MGTRGRPWQSWKGYFSQRSGRQRNSPRKRNYSKQSWDFNEEVDVDDGPGNGGGIVEWKPYSCKEDGVQLSPQQRYVLELIRKGENVFYTGNAGTGKTTLLKEIMKCAPNETSVTALTGVAAVQAGGVTLHSFAGIGLGNGTKEDLYSIVRRGQKAKNWKSVQVLIIDEVSMLDGRLFDKLDYIAQKMKRKDAPFGGIQLILCGDFFQLPPIPKVGDTSVNYCFQSGAWSKCLKHILELTQIYRQSDPKLIKLLNEVRYENLSQESLQLLDYLKRPLPAGDIEPTKLHSHNSRVNDINNHKLASLPGPEEVYLAKDTGKSPYRDQMNKYVIAMDRLVLKVGAQVMLLKNLTEELINGSRGIVLGFNEDKKPIVKFADGQEKTITELDWNLEHSSGEVLARRTQIPLKLAWAMTIHKSQGMSIDLLQVDLKHVFAQGQAYVALSRARTLEGLQVLSFDQSKFTTSEAVVRFYRDEVTQAPVASTDDSSPSATTTSGQQEWYTLQDTNLRPNPSPGASKLSPDNLSSQPYKPSPSSGFKKASALLTGSASQSSSMSSLSTPALQPRKRQSSAKRPIAPGPRGPGLLGPISKFINTGNPGVRHGSSWKARKEIESRQGLDSFIADSQHQDQGMLSPWNTNNRDPTSHYFASGKRKRTSLLFEPSPGDSKLKSSSHRHEEAEYKGTNNEVCLQAKKMRNSRDDHDTAVAQHRDNAGIRENSSCDREIQSSLRPASSVHTMEKGSNELKTKRQGMPVRKNTSRALFAESATELDMSDSDHKIAISSIKAVDDTSCTNSANAALSSKDSSFNRDSDGVATDSNKMSTSNGSTMLLRSTRDILTQAYNLGAMSGSSSICRNCGTDDGVELSFNKSAGLLLDASSVVYKTAYTALVMVKLAAMMAVLAIQVFCLQIYNS